MRYRNIKARQLHSMVYSLLLTLTFICIGCQDDDLAQSEMSTDAITFSLYSNGEDAASPSPSTRTADRPIVLVSEDGTDSLAFYLTITDTIDLGESANQADTTITRGTPITDANLSSCSGKIALEAFYQDKDFFQDVIQFTNGNTHTSITHYWPAGEVAFWSYHPKDIDEATNANFNITNGDSPTLSFHYDQASKLAKVAQQEDLFFAYVKQGKEAGTVQLQYNHALTAVKFRAGQALGGTITNISVTGICYGGTLTYTPNETTKLSWELDGETSSLNQDFDFTVDENLTGEPSQAITRDDAGTTFLLIPQEINQQNQLSITFERPGKDPVTYTAQMPAVTWEMGKTYTYTLKLMDGLDIEASASVESQSQTINGIEIKNTYRKSCYIRAMIIANWVDNDGNVAALFNPANAEEQDRIDLTIKADNNNYTLGPNWAEYWLYDETNNIYYYKKPLKETESTEVNLFDKFTNPKDRSTEDLKLDFTVLIQAVEAETDKASVKAAWGEDIANKLEAPNN